MSIGAITLTVRWIHAIVYSIALSVGTIVRKRLLLPLPGWILKVLHQH